MANVLSPEQQDQVRAMGRLGWSLRRIQGTTGVHRDTVRNYLLADGIRMRRERARRLDADDSKPASQVTPGSGAAPAAAAVLTSVARSHCEAHRDLIAGALDQGRNGNSIWQELVDRHGFAGIYQSVKRFVLKLQPSSAVAHRRITSAPGDEGQVDYATGPLVKHPTTGEYRRTRLFALTLGCSWKASWMLAWQSSSKVWCELHEVAFRRLVGAPRTIVIDNLR
jgi:hypothetical protein